MGEWDDATRQAHTLKGLAASLGANEIPACAAALEKAAHAHDLVEARANLTRTTERLAPLVAALRLHFGIDTDAGLQAPGNAAMSAAPGRADAATAEAPVWLPRLRELLRQADVEAKELWESKRDEIASCLPVHMVQRVSLALDNFNFDAALRLLEDIPSN